MDHQTISLPELFYTINLILSIIASILAILFGCLIILIIIINKPSHTITNLLTCNSGLCIISFEIVILISSIYGRRNDYLYYQPACTIRAYCIVLFCAVIAYSYLIQSISRLFFVVFYQYKNLQTYSTHYILIIINWCIGILILSTIHLIDNHVAVLIPQFRFCAISFNSLTSTIFMGFSVFIIPFCCVIIIYITIFIRIRRSNNRIQPINLKSSTKGSNFLPNMKREIKLVKITLILWSCFAYAGTPYFLLIIWKLVFNSSAPEALYLISINLIVINCGLVLTVALFLSNDLKKYMFETIKKFF